MKINELLNTNCEIEITGISNNSKEIEPGNAFVCTRGATVDRHDFIDDAIQNGASVIVASHPIETTVPVIVVENTDETFLDMIQKYNGYPHQKMKMLGVTGTDGKTTVATILYEILNHFSTCGYIGTNGIYCPGYECDNNNTMPGIEVLYPALRSFYEHQCEYASLEVTSEALTYHRADKMEFDGTILTNITSDHMNTHKTIENYVAIKSTLFEKTKKNGVSILNVDDLHYEEVKKHCHERIITYGIENEADLRATDIQQLPHKTVFKLHYQRDIYIVESPLECRFNVYNLLAALGALVGMNFSLNEILKHLSDIHIDGRLTYVNLGQPFEVIIDYAHTVNGIDSLFTSLKEIYQTHFIVVSGIAGERDTTKRPAIGKILSDHADMVIFTSEDPRGEHPNDIVDQLLTDIKDRSNYIVEINRMKAIRKAISMAKPNDVVLVLGKGTESVQKIRKEKVYFNDYEAAKAILMENIYNEKLEYEQ